MLTDIPSRARRGLDPRFQLSRQPQSDASVGVTLQFGLAPAHRVDNELGVVADQTDLDRLLGQRLSELQRKLAEHLQHPGCYRALHGNGEKASSVGRRLVPQGAKRGEVFSQSFSYNRDPQASPLQLRLHAGHNCGAGQAAPDAYHPVPGPLRNALPSPCASLCPTGCHPTMSRMVAAAPRRLRPQVNQLLIGHHPSRPWATRRHLLTFLTSL